MARMRTVDAAGYVCLGKSTLEKFRVMGTGPRYYKLGGRVIYDTIDLDEWLAEHRQRGTAENPRPYGQGRPRDPQPSSL